MASVVFAELSGSKVLSFSNYHAMSKFCVAQELIRPTLLLQNNIKSNNKNKNKKNTHNHHHHHHNSGDFGRVRPPQWVEGALLWG